MGINHGVKSSKENQHNQGFIIIFFALNVLLVPFSAYATYAGYKEFLDHGMAILLALVTALLFAGLNWFIAEKRKNGEPHYKQVIGFCIPLMISFFGNFAYFYGGQMEGTLLDKDLTHYRTILSETYNNAIGGLNKKQQQQIDSVIIKNELVGLRTKLDSELGVLKLQIADGGCYSRCREKWDEIKQLFADYNRKQFGTPGSPLTKVYTKTYANFEKVANSQFAGYQIRENREIQTVKQNIQVYKDHIHNSTDYKKLISLSDTLLLPVNENRLKSEGERLIKNVQATNTQIGQYAASVIHSFSFDLLPPYEGINRRNFKGVLKNAFITVESPSATFISVVLSLTIDLATLGFIVLILEYSRRRRRHIKIKGPQRVD